MFIQLSNACGILPVSHMLFCVPCKYEFISCSLLRPPFCRRESGHRDEVTRPKAHSSWASELASELRTSQCVSSHCDARPASFRKLEQWGRVGFRSFHSSLFKPQLILSLLPPSQRGRQQRAGPLAPVTMAATRSLVGKAWAQSWALSTQVPFSSSPSLNLSSFTYRDVSQ